MSGFFDRVRNTLYFRGAVLVFVSGGCWSLTGLILRHLDSATGWQILFYRSAGVTALLLLVIVVRSRSRVVPAFCAIGRAGIVAGLCLGTLFAVSIFSLLNTTVANTVFLQSTQIFFGAVLGWLILGELVRRPTWIAMAVAISGVALMIGEGFAHDTLFGNLLGLLGGVMIACYAVAMRAGKIADMLPATCLGGAVGIVAGAVMASDLAISLHDIVLCLVMGVFTIGLGFLLFTIGSRHIPAVDLLLLALSEVVLAPVWVWVILDEVPADLTLLGGAAVLGAVIAQTLIASRQPVPTGDSSRAVP